MDWSKQLPLACQDFLLWHTAFRKGSREGMPRADATTAKALREEDQHHTAHRIN